MNRVSVTAALLLVTSAAGCFGQPLATTVTHTFSVNGTAFDVPLMINTSGPDGFLAYRLENPLNVSFALEYEYLQDTGRLNPLQIIVLLDGEEPFVPATLKGEKAEMDADDAYVRVGPVEWQEVTPSAGNPPHLVKGVEFHFTNATGATLLVTWAGLASPATIWTQWIPGTRVTAVHETSQVRAWTLREFQGSFSAGSAWATASLQDQATFGVGGASLYAVMVVDRPSASRGEIVVGDANGHRALLLEERLHDSSTRAVLTAHGTTTFTVTAAAIPSLDVYLVAAVAPSGILPADLWQVW